MHQRSLKPVRSICFTSTGLIRRLTGTREPGFRQERFLQYRTSLRMEARKGNRSLVDLLGSIAQGKSVESVELTGANLRVIREAAAQIQVQGHRYSEAAQRWINR